MTDLPNGGDDQQPAEDDDDAYSDDETKKKINPCHTVATAISSTSEEA
jgi:hypothetical protein